MDALASGFRASIGTARPETGFPRHQSEGNQMTVSTDGTAPGDEAAPGTPSTGENLCRACNGSGKQGEEPCPECEGSGKIIEGIGGA
jgi:DnaJ-class molecular chaperone